MKLFIHHPIFRIVMPFLVGGIAYLSTLMVFGRMAEVMESFAMGEWLLCTGLAYILFEGLRLLNLFLNRRLNFEEKMYVAIWTQLGINVLFSLCVIGLGVSAYFFFVLGFRSLSSFSIEMWTINLIYAFITLAYTSAVNSISILHTQNKRAWKEAKFRQESLNLSLIRYNQEIQPELLYHGLETIIPFLYENQDRADELIQKLSQIYRYQLEKRKEELVKLSEELKMVQAWLYIHQQKYPGQIKWEAKFEETDFQFLILPGSLSNCISHLMQQTLFSQIQPLHIHVHIRENTLWLRIQRNDRLVSLSSDVSYLDTLQQCYRPFTERNVEESLSQTERNIALPMLIS